MSRLALFVLGPPRIELNGTAVEINRRKAVALLVYLAVTAESHSRDTLATLLWPDYDQTQARAALRRTLSTLKKPLGQWLEIERDLVSLKPDDGAESAVWLDAQRFNELVAAGLSSSQAGETLTSECLPHLAEAVALYRDDFLAGFTLRDSPAFDEWQFFQTESLRQKLAGVLERLAQTHNSRGEFEPAIAYARRWLLLDPLHEPAQRHLMHLYTSTHQRAAALRQYRECVRLLKAELGISPSAETTALYERIRNEAGDAKRGSGGAEIESSIIEGEGLKMEDHSTASIHHPPSAILHPPSAILYPLSSPPFVGRERELAQLDRFLQAVLAGRGQVALIVGEAGSGKTALLQEFARRAQAMQPDLVVAIGNCNTHTGVGDPYLPFREALNLLSGDVEAQQARGVISQENARRLRRLRPLALQTLAQFGPDLLTGFLSGAAVAARGPHPDISSGHKPGNGANGAQRDLFDQFNQVLQTLAQRQPLLLALDDLQWADAASLNLLFHLGRQLEGSRILLVLTYRPDDVALGRQSTAGVRERHPLEPVINELKRRYGEIEIDLGQTTGREFVEAFLDTQPNGLGPAFRTALYRRTQGHPLFTVELLRDLQERGDIVRDAQGRWVEEHTINWDTLPARVEAVVAERVDRLEPQLREMLTVASVEGREFTAQVIARLLQLPERQALRLLSQELAKRHQLVREAGEVSLGEQRLSRYQFSHVLFQHYLYQELGAGERRLWHREVAAALEALYTDQNEAITMQLAHHYAEAGQSNQAIGYLLAAGDRARRLYAHQEATDFYQRALAFLKEQGLTSRERAARTLMKLGLTHHLAFDFRQARQAFEEGFAMWQWTGESRPALSPAPHALRMFHPIDPSTLDPALARDVETINIVDQLFSGLVALSPELDVIPEMAQTWEVLEGGRNYIFHLRADVCWSDGVPVSAGDFVYAWRRALDRATRSAVATMLYDVKGARAFHRGETADAASLGVRALDPVTLLVELEQPTGHFPNLLANSAAYPLPRHIVQSYGPAWTEVEHMVVNGPFCLKSRLADQAITLTRNPLYRGQASGNVQEVTLLIVPKSTATLERYEADEVDILYLWNLPPAERDRARQRHAGEYVFGPALDTTYVGFNISRPPFNDVRVRQALTLATDRETLVNGALGGYDSPALGGFVPPGMPGHSPEIGLPFDLEQARRLLAQAGYPGGHGFPAIEWLIKPSHQLVADYLQSQWRTHLGLALRWNAVGWDQLLDRLDHAPPDLFDMGWMADYLDPDSFLRVSMHNRWFNWGNQVYAGLIERTRQITDQAERLKLYRQADRLLIEEAVILPLTYPRQHLLVKPWVTQFPMSALRGWYWKDVIIEPH